MGVNWISYKHSKAVQVLRWTTADNKCCSFEFYLGVTEGWEMSYYYVGDVQLNVMEQEHLMLQSVFESFSCHIAAYNFL